METAITTKRKAPVDAILLWCCIPLLYLIERQTNTFPEAPVLSVICKVIFFFVALCILLAGIFSIIQKKGLLLISIALIPVFRIMEAIGCFIIWFITKYSLMTENNRFQEQYDFDLSSYWQKDSSFQYAIDIVNTYQARGIYFLRFAFAVFPLVMIASVLLIPKLRQALQKKSVARIPFCLLTVSTVITSLLYNHRFLEATENGLQYITVGFDRCFLLSLIPAIIACVLLWPSSKAFTEKKSIKLVPALFMLSFFLLDVVQGIFGYFHLEVLWYVELITAILLCVAFFLLVDKMICPYKTKKVPPVQQLNPDEPQYEELSAEYNEIFCDMTKHILLCLFTFGVWYLIWIYKATKYLNRAPEGEQYDPKNKLLLCLFVPFYQIYWFYKHGQKLDSLMKARKTGGSEIATLCLILGIFIPVVACILMQDKFNQLCVTMQPELEAQNASSPEGAFPAPSVAQAAAQNPESEAIANLRKYKDLLDSGVITQEEFDAKKKQILGL